MSEIFELTDFIKQVCLEYSLHVEEASDGNFKIFTDSASGITLILKIKEPTDFSFYFLERTYDILYQGDRTDVHVIMSLMFASFLRVFDLEMSCLLFDIPHPAVEDEIWGRYIMPAQVPSLLGISSWSQLKDIVHRIVLMVAFWRDIFWQFAGCPCKECLTKNDIEDNIRGYDVPFEMIHSENKSLKSSISLNYGNRPRPEWNYFYDITNEITVIKSESLIAYLEWIHIFCKHKFEKVEGIQGKLILYGELKNFLSNGHHKELKKIAKALGQNLILSDKNVFPLENMFIVIQKPYIIALGRLCGILEFKKERELLRARHNIESKLLFPVALFEWEENICPDQFEGLIKILLEREPDVKTVRKVSPTNQGDRGRDLLIEWHITNESIKSNVQPPISLIKVVGQCKAINKTVGKNKVLDIRDTIDTHNAQGYFLAVSSQISEPLTSKLEELRAKGIWTDWWNREDIELRLSKNQDLLPAFPKVLKAKHQIKFVEKEEDT